MSAPTYVNATTGEVVIDCIARSESPEIPLWECPCRECTKLDWDACDDETKSSYGSLRVWRHCGFPEYYDHDGHAILQEEAS